MNWKKSDENSNFFLIFLKFLGINKKDEFNNDNDMNNDCHEEVMTKVRLSKFILTWLK